MCIGTGVQVSTASASEGDRHDEEANAPSQKQFDKKNSRGGKWLILSAVLVIAAVIVVVVTPPSVIVPRKKNKTTLALKTATGPITVAEIDAAQKAWGEALVQISSTYSKSGFDAAKAVAQQVLDSAYGYKVGFAVSFKPTLTTGEQTFRPTNEGALAYFVGHDADYPNDSGFALKGWTDVTSVRAGVLVDPSGEFALSMGNVFIKNKDGTVTVVDKT